MCTAILNEQQTGNCNVAVASLHCLLLHNVYSPYFGVSYRWNKCNANVKSDCRVRARLLSPHQCDSYCFLFLQTPRCSQLLPASLVSQRPHQCPSVASKAATLSAEQSFPGPGSSRGQLPLSAVLTHPGQLLSHHQYPFTVKQQRYLAISAAVTVYSLKALKNEFWKLYVGFPCFPCSWQIFTKPY